LRDVRILLLVVAVMALAAVGRQALLARRRRTLPSADGSGMPRAGGTQELRRVVLRREFLAGTPPAPSGEPRAVVMDWGLDNGAASLVAYDDDTTSLYLSSGGGVIGAGAHESVRRAARALRAEADAVRSHFAAIADDDPLTLPSAGGVTFYLVTDSATLRAGPVGAELLAANAHALARLGNQAQAVITAIREAGP
jgi:hypothetical protein